MPKTRLLAGARQPRETVKAVLACNAYLRYGPRRSFTKLLEQFKEQPDTAPTFQRKTLENWSVKFGWVARAEEYDLRIEEERNARYDELMSTGLAVDAERVAKLKKLFKLLEADLYAKNEAGDFINLWLEDIRSVGGGEYVNVVKYNAALISDIRGLLDDLAKETGGRKARTDITSGDEPIEVLGIEIIRPMEEPSNNGHGE